MSSKDKAEIQALAEKIKELIQKHPEKAAKILTDWLHNPQKSKKTEKSKKAA